MNMKKVSNDFILLVLIIVLFLFCQNVFSKRVYLLKKPQCSEDNFQKIDLLIAKLMIIGPNGRKMPETEPQVRIFCKNTFQMLRQVENFWKNCFKSPVKEYASVAIYTVRIQIKKYCTSKKSKVVKELLKLAPCANKYIIHNNSCLVKMENKVKNLVYLEKDKPKFNYLCWWVFCCLLSFKNYFVLTLLLFYSYYSEAVYCSESAISDVACLRPHLASVMDFYRGIAQSQVDMICGEYNGQNDVCQKLTPPKTSKINRNKYYNIITVIIDILASIKDPNSVPLFS